jgi:hypothetical protein
MTAAFDGHSATEHAEAAADAVRAINHITGRPAGLTYPSEAYRIVGQLATVAARLPQACEQITRQLRRWSDAGQVGIDAGTTWAGNPAGAVLDALAGLDEAAVAAEHLYAGLDQASGALCYAHYTGPDLDDGRERGVGA